VIVAEIHRPPPPPTTITEIEFTIQPTTSVSHTIVHRSSAIRRYSDDDDDESLQDQRRRHYHRRVHGSAPIATIDTVGVDDGSSTTTDDDYQLSPMVISPDLSALLNRRRVLNVDNVSTGRWSSSTTAEHNNSDSASFVTALEDIVVVVDANGNQFSATN
jgi:hypothetical protein